MRHTIGWALFLAALVPAGARAAEVTISVRPEQVGVAIPIVVKEKPGLLVRQEAGRRVEVPGQQISLPDGTKGTAYVLPAAAQAGAQKWQLLPEGKAADPFKLAEQEGGKLLLTEDGKPVAAYNYEPQLPKGVPERYRRPDYFHPVYDLDGETILTDDFPKDHLHHRGLYWIWPDVKVGEKSYDPWTCIGGMVPKFKRWLARETGPACAVIGVENGWFLGDKAVVDEKVWTTVYRAGKDARIMDISLTLEAEEQPVGVRGQQEGKKGYGGFSIRFAPRRDAAICTPDGRLKSDGVQLRTPWSDYTGKFGKQETPSGVALFDDPKNPGYPNPWLQRYYGFLNPQWPGLDWVTLEKGKPVTLRYRVVIHKGSTDEAKIAAAFDAFAHPPAIEK